MKPKEVVRDPLLQLYDPHKYQENEIEETILNDRECNSVVKCPLWLESQGTQQPLNISYSNGRQSFQYSVIGKIIITRSWTHLVIV